MAGKNIRIVRELRLFKKALSEDFELSASAKKHLKEARRTPRSKYIKQADVEKDS
jgi:hypothetical protein